MVEPGENIFLFIPNLIGYGRILLALLSFYWMPTDYSRAFWCYALSAFLDAWDGHAARYFRQSTKFGALLDQLTDRCGTMCLLVTLSYFYPKYMFCFQVSMSIDIASHWLHTQVNVWINRCYLKLLFPIRSSQICQPYIYISDRNRLVVYSFVMVKRRNNVYVDSLLPSSIIAYSIVVCTVAWHTIAFELNVLELPNLSEILASSIRLLWL